jgi:PAS domain S-box-containing protein
MTPSDGALLEQALQHLDAAVVVVRADQSVVWESPSCERLLGVRVGDLTQERFIRLCHVDDVIGGTQSILQGSGEVRWWVNEQWRRIRVVQAGSVGEGVLVVLSDVTDAHAMVERVEVLKALMDAAVELARDGSVTEDTLAMDDPERVEFAEAVRSLTDEGTVLFRGRTWRSRIMAISTGALVAMRDTAEIDLSLRRDALWRRVVESLAEGFWLLDQHGTIVECNSTALEMVGLRRSEALGKSLHDIAPQLAGAGHRESVVEMHSGGQVLQLECRRSAMPLHHDDDGEVLVVRDVTKESALQTALALERRTLFEVNEELRAVVAAIANARGRERAAIARRLHDDPIQRLAALRWRLTGADPLAASDLEACYEALRQVVFDLRPQALLERGLTAALQEMEELDERVSVTASDVDDVEAEIADLVWRNVREAVRNAITHSGGTRIDVMALRRGESVVCEVRDDGCGVTPEGLRAAERRGHIGVASIRETVAEAGGTFWVMGLDTGTTVRMEVPGRWQTG